MKPRNTISWVSTGLLGAACVSLLTGCETDEIQAIVAGVELVAERIFELDDDSRDIINFGDFLLDQLRD